MAATTTTKDITIVGGGIIGCTTAYFLTRHPAYSPATHRITLLEASSSSNSGGRTPNSVADPTALADAAAATAAEGAGNKSVTACRPRKEHDGIASGASGKAGGLLARWAFPRTIAPLSFRLHAELAATHGGAAAWGYRRCTAAQVECRASLVERKSKKEAEEGSGGSGGGGTKGLHKDHKKDQARRGKSGAPPELDWVDEDALLAYDEIGGPDDTAQVHPELFTHRMAQLAEEAGARIVTGARVTAINTGGDGGAIESVTYTVKDDEGETTRTLPTTDCVVAAGPWTSRLLPQVPVTASRAHSIVVRAPPPGLSAHALFTSIALPRGFFPEPDSGAPGGHGERGRRALARPTTVEPEIYARPDGTAYACGPTDDAEELPDTAAAVRVDEARCADVAAQVAAISGALASSAGGGGDQDDGPSDANILARQACYLPQGGPFIGPVSRAGRGIVVAAGHTCWGIQNAPATGLLVSELVFDGKASSANLAGLLPR